MKLYKIWKKGRYSSGGFSESYDEPTSMIFTTREKAVEHLPPYSNDGYGSYERYYIKECEIE